MNTLFKRRSGVTWSLEKIHDVISIKLQLLFHQQVLKATSGDKQLTILVADFLTGCWLCDVITSDRPLAETYYTGNTFYLFYLFHLHFDIKVCRRPNYKHLQYSDAKTHVHVKCCNNIYQTGIMHLTLSLAQRINVQLVGEWSWTLERFRVCSGYEVQRIVFIKKLKTLDKNGYFGGTKSS